MNGFTELEYELDDNTVLLGIVKITEDNQLEYDTFAVLTSIRGFEYDVTKAFSEEQLNNFKESFRLGAIDKRWDELKGRSEDYYEEQGA